VSPDFRDPVFLEYSGEEHDKPCCGEWTEVDKELWMDIVVSRGRT